MESVRWLSGERLMLIGLTKSVQLPGPKVEGEKGFVGVVLSSPLLG